MALRRSPDWLDTVQQGFTRECRPQMQPMQDRLQAWRAVLASFPRREAQGVPLHKLPLRALQTAWAEAWWHRRQRMQ